MKNDNIFGGIVSNNAADDANRTGDRLLDVLLDPNNQEPIVLMDETGRQIMFEQVAIIPIDDADGERNVYVILKPMDKLMGINDDEAIVFVIVEDDNGNAVLRVEADMAVASEVFDRFYKMLEEANKRGSD